VAKKLICSNCGYIGKQYTHSRFSYVFFFGIIVILVLTFFSFQQAYASLNVYHISKEIVGQEYNSISKHWFNRRFSILVGIKTNNVFGENNAEYIIFRGEGVLGNAIVMIRNSKFIRDKLEKTIEKAIKWSNIAKKNQVDIQKSLGCFGNVQYGNNQYDLCENGLAYNTNQVGLSFFATNGGKQTSLIISMVDITNQFIKTMIYVNVTGMRNILNTVKNIESKFKEVRRTIKKNQNLFK